MPSSYYILVDDDDAVALAFVMLLTLPSLGSIFRFRTGPKPIHLYQDEDGTATKESEAASHYTIATSVINISTAIGLSTALAGAYGPLASPTWKEFIEWFWVAVWVCISRHLAQVPIHIKLTLLLQTMMSIQAIAISRELSFRQRHTYGICGSLSAAVISASAVYRWKYWQNIPESDELLWPHIVAAMAVIFGCITLPRRPIVFFNGKQVDQENGAPILDRLTFSWSPFHQSRAAISETIDLHDLPDVSHKLRARTLKDRFNNTLGGKVGELILWKQLLRTLRRQLIHQWLLIFLKATSEFGSRFALYRLLQCLELSSLPKGNSLALTWVAGLAFCHDDREFCV